MKLLAVCLSLLPACHVAATSPDRYIVKLCETSWLDREPAETAAALAESVGARAATYSEANGLQLSVTQSRTCGKEESCAAGGHDDNDDNDDHSHSDGAAKLGPLAALFIAAITIITL